MSKPYDVDALIKLSIEQMDKAYCPYSNYRVGCALVAEDGTVFGGSNIENASNSMTICAERSAMTYACSQGHRKFKIIVVATRDGGSCCGGCRQFIREFVHPSEDVPILLVTPDGTVKRRTSIEELLPFSFGPDNLTD